MNWKAIVMKKRYFKNNQSYFNFINKYKIEIRLVEIKTSKKGIVVKYEPIEGTSVVAQKAQKRKTERC